MITALDFLAEVQGQAETPGYDDVLSPADLTDIGRIIREQDERRARSQLIRMRANLTCHAFLTDDQQRRMNALLDGIPVQARRVAAFSFPKLRLQWWLLVPVSAGLVLGLVFGIIVPWVHGNTVDSSPLPGTAQQNPPAPNIPPPAYSDLQLFEQGWGPWNQITPSDSAPQTSAPALLLLKTGGYYASGTWTISPTARGWSQDIGGNVGNVNIHGDYADITDADGNPYVVGINQPFVVSSSPGLVLRIDPTGTVYSMSTAQAAVVRHHL